MKKLGVTGLMLIMGLISFCQTGQREDRTYLWPENEVTNKYDFSGMVYIFNVGADVLYNSTKAFTATRFKSEHESVLFENDTTKSISGRGAFPAVVPELGERGKGYISYTLTLSCNSYGYKYSITDLEHFASTAGGVVGGPLESDRTISGGMLFPRKYWESVKEKCYYNVQITIEQLKEFMSKHAVVPAQ